jgi:hypothetical protein
MVGYGLNFSADIVSSAVSEYYESRVLNVQ